MPTALESSRTRGAAEGFRHDGSSTDRGGAAYALRHGAGLERVGRRPRQSVWEADWLPGATRIVPASWSHPDRDDWVDAIDRCVRAGEGDVVLVAHSLGCFAVAQWLESGGDRRVRGAFLVAPPDERAESFPAELLSSFMEPVVVGVPALLVASENDPYCALEAAGRIAGEWQVPLVSAGAQGHINSASKLEDWPVGQRLLTSFVAGLVR
ncbi:RBBP9/YdeN family alpha/beta hydrolase [Kribbella sp. NPDC056345]|uniref:RBBP9/YdeN family alpha/beta hydrolase n=1 Tax=Kribbella sp. NPDC056345 TaxID=3345789 RepID=UPI0035DF21EA